MESQADARAALRTVLTASRPDGAVFDAAFSVSWSADAGPAQGARTRFLQFATSIPWVDAR